MKKRKKKLLLIAMYWLGDKRQMLDALQAFNDLIKEDNETVELLLISRHDCDYTPTEREEMRRYSQLHYPNFGKVHFRNCRRRGTGWPMGPNEMYFDAFSNFGEYGDFECITFVEPDCVPVKVNWHTRLLENFTREISHAPGKFVLGHIHSGNATQGAHNGKHTNAVACYHRDFPQQLPKILSGCDGNVGWDWAFGEEVSKMTVDDGSFAFEFRKEFVSEEDMARIANDPHTIVYHGVKDRSALAWVEANLCSKIQKIEAVAAANGFIKKQTRDGKTIFIPQELENETCVYILPTDSGA